MTEILSKNKQVEAVVDSILFTFPIVDKISLKQYLDYFNVTSQGDPLEKYIGIPYLHSRQAVEERFEGIAYLKRNAAIGYDTASLNVFSMIVAMSEFAGVDELITPIEAVRCAFPYDYIYTTDKKFFLFINFDKNGEKKLRAHNYVLPENYLLQDSEIEQLTVVTASDGFANEVFYSHPVRGEAMLAEIKRTPTNIHRNIKIIGMR